MHKSLAVLAFAVGSVFSSAHAAIVSFNFTATLQNDFGNGTSSGVGIADIALMFEEISGTITYDTNIPPRFSNPGIARYVTGTLLFNEFSIPDFEIETSIIDRGNRDQFRIGGGNGDAGAGLSFETNTQSVFENTELPTDLTLSEFVIANVQIFSSGGRRTGVFRITSLQRTSMPEVPLPAAFPLFLVGLLTVASRLRKSAMLQTR